MEKAEQLNITGKRLIGLLGRFTLYMDQKCEPQNMQDFVFR